MSEQQQQQSCTFFEPGFSKCELNNSFNCNDERGKAVTDRTLAGSVLLVVGLILLIVFGVRLARKKTKTWWILASSVACLIVSAGLAIDVGVRVAADPIVVVYAISALITQSVRTPPQLSLDANFPQHREFEENFVSIKREVAEVVRNQDKLPLTKDTFAGQNETIGKDVKVNKQTAQVDGWRIFVVSVGETFTPSAERTCPTLCALLKKHKDVVGSCVVSILPPNCSIPRHVGYYKGCMRYMLGVEIPDPQDQVYLCVNDEKVNWQEGKSILWDDTYPHKVFNRTSGRRVVLYMDVLRPLRSKLLSGINRSLARMFQQSAEVKKEIARTEYLLPIKE